MRTRFSGLLGRAVLLAAGAFTGATAGAAVGGLFAMWIAAAPADVACAADDSCAPGLGMAGVLGGLLGAFLGGATGLVAAGMVVMRRTLRKLGAAG